MPRNRSLITFALAVVAYLSVACGGPGGSGPGTETNPSADQPNAAHDNTDRDSENPGATPAPNDADPTPVGGEATKTGADPQDSKLTEQDTFDVNAVLKTHRDDLTTCYDDDLSIVELPDDGFLVKAKFTIEADGTVAGAEIVEATQRFEKSEACFLLNLATIQFPPPPEGRVIETTYPFKIKRKVVN